MVCKVVHLKREHYDVLCDRTTNLGNPFVIGKDGTREEVIRKHRAWFMSNREMVEYVMRNLKDKVLGCWCKPKACHCDIYADVANKGAWWCWGCQAFHVGLPAESAECPAISEEVG